MSRDELIAALEKATGPDEMLDDDIHWFVGEWENLGGWMRRHKVTGERTQYTYTKAPAYTASIDAALTLVPEGYYWGVTKGADDIGPPVNRSPKNFSAGCWPEPLSFQQRVWAKTAAIALCIACLKARATVYQGGGAK